MKPGVWEARVEVGRDPVTGKRRQVCRWVHGTRRDAQRVLNEMSVEADRGRFTGTTTTFAQLTEQWLKLASKGLSPTTVRTYKNLLDKRILPALGDMPVKNIKSSDLDNLYDGLEVRVKLSTATIRQIHAIIRRAFRQAILWEWVSTNPAANATPPRLKKSDVSPPDVDQVGVLLGAAKERNPEFARLLHIAATTGARRGELCAIRWRNVNLDLRTLTIERAIIDVKGGFEEKDTKTHASRRISLDAETLEVFEEQRAVSQERADTASIEVDDDAFVFSRELDGTKPWTPDSVTSRFVTIRDELGYKNMRFHDLRHFAATRLMAAGVPVRTVSGRLGHANPSTTLSVYSHFVEASDQEAAGIMGGLVSSTKAKHAGKPVEKKPVKKKPRKQE